MLTLAVAGPLFVVIILIILIVFDLHFLLCSGSAYSLIRSISYSTGGYGMLCAYARPLRRRGLSSSELGSDTITALLLALPGPRRGRSSFGSHSPSGDSSLLSDSPSEEAALLFLFSGTKLSPSSAVSEYFISFGDRLMASCGEEKRDQYFLQHRNNQEHKGDTEAVAASLLKSC